MAKRPVSAARRLCIAANEGDLEAVSQLLAEGTDPNATDKEFGTPLCAASRKGHAQIAEKLIEHGADTNGTFSDFGTPLYQAAREGHLDVVKVLLQQGAEVNGRGGPAFHIPLCYAIRDGRQELIRVLLDHGADLHYAGYDASTPLTCAVSGGCVEIARLFIERGAKRVNGRGEPLTKYIHKHMRNRESMLQLLVEHGIDISGIA
jgi:ankyrin repeat protein